jgi:hypothetical protein
LGDWLGIRRKSITFCVKFYTHNASRAFKNINRKPKHPLPSLARNITDTKASLSSHYARKLTKLSFYRLWNVNENEKNPYSHLSETFRGVGYEGRLA